MYKLLTILLAATLLASCENVQNETTRAFTPEIDEPEFYFQGTVSVDGNQTPFSLFIGATDDNNQRFFMGSTLSAGNNGPTLLVGTYIANLNVAQRILPRIELQFWPDNLGDDSVWQPEEIQDYFAVGNQYSLGGEGADYFHLSLLLPLDGTSPDVETSQSRFLESPDGQLIITEVEEYHFTDIGAEMVSREGLLIRCEFEAEVGRYDSLADQADGMPGFQTDEVVEFRDGEATFFVPYD